MLKSRPYLISPSPRNILIKNESINTAADKNEIRKARPKGVDPKYL